jgi:hypothetical protein
MHGTTTWLIYTTYKNINIFFSKATPPTYTGKLAPQIHPTKSNLTVQINAIPPNQIYLVHLAICNVGLVLIPLRKL